MAGDCEAFLVQHFLPDYARMLAAAFLFDYVLTDPDALLPIEPLATQVLSLEATNGNCWF